MPLYRYESFNKKGEHMNATIEAAKELVRTRGLMPIRVYELSSAQAGFSIRTIFEKKTDVRTVVLFTKQLTVLLRSGVPLLASIELLTDQFEGEFKRVLIN